MSNLFADVPADLKLPEELVEVLSKSAHVRIERIVSTGHVSPEGFWYDQNEHEWVVVLSGSAQLQFEEEKTPRSMKPGDHMMIPAHRRHRVVMTSPNEPTVWLAVFLTD